ncbi:MAG: hypothetical protein LBL93_06680 [Ruminococcus sp.]|nr:hypothetical protein [Ruminococcus sp.]
MNLLVSELYKSTKNTYIWLAMLLVIAVALLSRLVGDLKMQIVLLLDVYEVAVFFIVGSIWGSEYTNSTIKNLIINHSRSEIFVVKSIVVFIFVGVIALIDAVLVGMNFADGTFLQHIMAFFGHSVLLIFTSQVFMGIAATSMVAIAVFFIYHFILTMNTNGIFYDIAENSVPILFVYSYYDGVKNEILVIFSILTVMVYFLAMFIFCRTGQR